MAIVQLGNRFPAHVRPEDRRGDHVTEINVPDEFTDEWGTVHWDVPKKFDHGAVRAHLEQASSPYRMAQTGVTRLADHTGQNCEALVPFLHPLYGVVTPFEHGHFAPGGDGNPSGPTWVWSDNKLLAKHISEWHQCPILDDRGLRDIEDTHTTKFGPPGVVPGAVLNFNGLFTNVGRVAFNQMMGGGPITGQTGQLSASSTTTATTAFTTSSTTQFTGARMYATVSASSMVWGNVISCTNGANSVITVDRWYTPSTPGGSAGSTPSATGTWMIPDGGTQSFWFMGLTMNNTAPAATDTSLTSEITTAGAGFIRKICTYAQTSGVANTQYTLTAVYTANGSDVLPYNTNGGINKIGIFNSMVSSDTTQTMMWETAYGSAAAINTSGDQLTSVDTITGS